MNFKVLNLKMVNVPTILVIFGVTGDLTKKKLAPALFHLYKKGKLPDRFKVVGFARRDWSDEYFREYLAEVLKEHRDVKNPQECVEFLDKFSYERGEFGTKSDYVSLKETLEKIDESWGMCSNKLFYLAVMPELYEPILKNISITELNEPCDSGGGWLRIIVEKPFGKDLKTARKLDILLGKLFKEEQLYRIDHYLAKEMLQNILIFRFSNNLFEKNWGRETIESIEIKLWEKLGVEGRGNFYDGVGALRDVGQNHLLQMLALVIMERPEDFSADAVREKRAESLKMLKIPKSDEIKQTAFRAQYEGYRTVQGVEPDSQTETYFKIRAYLDSPRWRGVPITMESGKRMREQRKEITIRFHHPSPCLCPAGVHYQNKVVIALEPEERITIRFWSKKPGHDFKMEERTFEFLLRPASAKASAGKGQYVEEYEKLLLDCIFGEQTLFVSTDEVRAMWRFIDPIIEAWQKNTVPLKFYKPDSDEIIRLANLSAEEGRSLKKASQKEIGFIGLGKMGLNMALRLQEKGWKVRGFDVSAAARIEAKRRGVEVVDNLENLTRPGLVNVVWLMLPAGKIIDEVIFGNGGFVELFKRGDVIIDGGNSFYVDSARRAQKISRLGINFLDVGISGGPEGARNGSSLMIGGDKKVFERYEKLFSDLSYENGYGYFGKSGAGHFVKMVHNGIEYGMMQSLAEGFALLRAADIRGLVPPDGGVADKRGKKIKYRFDLEKIAELYNHGSVIESRLIRWLKKAYEEYGENLSRVSGSADYTGEGEWTVKTAKKLKVNTPVIENALKFRIKSKKEPSYTGKILTALRSQFGGHSIKPPRDRK